MTVDSNETARRLRALANDLDPAADPNRVSAADAMAWLEHICPELSSKIPPVGTAEKIRRITGALLVFVAWDVAKRGIQPLPKALDDLPPDRQEKFMGVIRDGLSLRSRDGHRIYEKLAEEQTHL